MNNGNTVREGTGRSVSATLVIPESDNGYAGRTYTVKLEGMAKGSLTGSTEFKISNPTSRTITISDLVTTDATGNLKIIVTEDSYSDISATVGRRKNSFNNLAYNPTSLDGEAGRDVTFSFVIPEDGFSEGMAINVTLDGFTANDVNLQNADTKASTTYVYYPKNFGNQNIQLLTENTVTGTRECKVTITADSFEEASKTINQVGAIIYKGNVTSLTGATSVNNNVLEIVSTTITSITSTNNTVTYNTTTSTATSGYDNKKITSTLNIKDLTVSGQNVTNNTNVEFMIKVEYKYKSGRNTYTGTTTITITKTISELKLTKQ